MTAGNRQELLQAQFEAVWILLPDKKLHENAHAIVTGPSRPFQFLPDRLRVESAGLPHFGRVDR